MKKSIVMIGLVVGLGFIGLSRAEERAWPWSPLGIGIAAPVQLPFISSDIYGIRIGGLFGYNHDVFGLDVGVAEMTSGDFAGVQGAAFSWTEGNAYGLQLSALANVVVGKSVTFQTALVNALHDDAGGLQLGAINYNESYAGVQAGAIINWNVTSSAGLQLGLINANQEDFFGWSFGALVNHAGTFRGFECGLINLAYDMTGCQLGLINACDEMHGVQLGLINLIDNSKLPIMVLANASF